MERAITQVRQEYIHVEQRSRHGRVMYINSAYGVLYESIV